MFQDISWGLVIYQIIAFGLITLFILSFTLFIKRLLKNSVEKNNQLKTLEKKLDKVIEILEEEKNNNLTKS
ncbi:DUF4083 domain-containing protein [Bacillus solitudinis]|uniref:DUF4083 domain-containing protein n=1 Tax=Bacillus solitudinis TaxID=2014074 RepID=UPI000C23BF7A|nr:DUF4083 domain-containing protein [Bacillus solitudinis]